MDFVEKAKSDLLRLSEEDFIHNHLLSEGNWYFKSFMEYSHVESIEREKELKEYIKNGFNLEKSDIFFVGSGKIGFSLNPKSKFRPFLIDESLGKPSDIDIAIISDNLFHEYWDLFRSSYSPQYSYNYKYISREIYRGYINERNIIEIPNCRKRWTPKIRRLRRCISGKFHLKHEITYRIYRNKGDFFEYIIQNLENLKRGVDNGF